jgi:hypothetical protein
MSGNFGFPGSWPSTPGWQVPSTVPLTEQAVRQFESALRIVTSQITDFPGYIPGKVLGWGQDGRVQNITISSTDVALPGDGRTVGSLSQFLANNAAFNVKDYPTVGDGVADDRAAVALASTNAGATGQGIVFPRGTYKIGSNLTLSVPVFLSAGAILKPASGVTVTVTGHFQAGLYQCIDVSLGGKVVFSKGSVTEIYPQWWGPISASVATIGAMLTALNTGTLGWNPRVRMPAGDYTLSGTLAGPNSLANIEFVGDNNRSTRFVWAGAASIPMVKLTNPRNVKFMRVGFVNSTANAPSYGLQLDSVTAGKTAAPYYNVQEECFFGGDGANAIVTGVGHTSSDASDQNNEQSKAVKCEFYNCSSAGWRVEHSNSLWHTIEECDFQGCGSAMSNYVAGVFGGGFTSIQCNVALCDKVFEIGPSRYPIQVFGGNGESNGWLINTPANITQGFGGMTITGGLWYCDPAKGIKWDSSAGFATNRLTLERVMTLGVPKFDFPGGDPVFIRGGSHNWSGVTSIKYASTVVIEDLPLYTDFLAVSTAYNTNARLVTRQKGMSVNAITLGAPDGSVQVDVKGIPDGALVEASYATPTTINSFKGGYTGMVITIYATNANTTIHRGAGINLKGSGIGATDFVMASGDLLVLQARGSSWYEIGRKTAPAAALADMAALATTQTAGGAYTATEQTMLNNVKADLTSLRTLVNQLLANRRAAGEQS